MKARVLITYLIVLINTFAGMGTVIEKETVPARAVITANNLIVSGLSGNDIILDFGEIPKSSINGRGAEARFKVEYKGEESLDINSNLTIELNQKVVEMKHEDYPSINAKLPATLSLEDNLGTFFNEQDGKIVGENIKINQSMSSKEIYRGKIVGIIDKEDINSAEIGKYKEQTTITVTLNKVTS